MHFGENQLSPGSLGISPLPTGHPTALQRRKVRPSSPHYRTFSLPMGSSPGFGSTPRDSFARFRLAFAPAPRQPPLNLATHSNSPAHSSIGTPSPFGSDCLWARGFRDCFTPLPGCFSPFPHGTRSLSVSTGI